jgi:urease accessory protein
MTALRIGLALTATCAATAASAHTGAGATDGFAAGLLHPVLGLDHALAIVAVGVWAGLLGGRALWAWPAAFIGLMVAGSMLGLSGTALPGAEIGVALSAVVLGAAVAFRPPLAIRTGALLCGAFALFHGHAHGAELPPGSNPLTYIAGFTLATAMLHAAGLDLGLALTRGPSPWLPRLAGGMVAAGGLVLLAP